MQLPYCTDGVIGRVDEFLVDPADSHITHLVLREGHVWGKRDVAISVSEIRRIEERDVFLSLGKKAVKALPAISMQPLNRVEVVAIEVPIGAKVRRRHAENGNKNLGYDVIRNEYVDMVEAGIIDPAKVTKGGLENAASIAAMILTTEALIAEKPEKKKVPAGVPSDAYDDF